MDAKHSTTHWREEQKHSYSRLRFQMTRIILSFIMSVVFPNWKFIFPIFWMWSSFASRVQGIRDRRLNILIKISETTSAQRKVDSRLYTVSHKNWTLVHLSITSANTVRFFIGQYLPNIEIAIMSVCLSVRDVPVSDENGLTYRHPFFTIQ